MTEEKTEKPRPPGTLGPEEFKAKTTEELLDPQAYRSAMRNGRARLLDMLHKVKVDLDLLALDAAESDEEQRKQKDEVIGTLEGQLTSLTNRINEIDRRLTEAETNDKAIMKPGGKEEGQA